MGTEGRGTLGKEHTLEGATFLLEEEYVKVLKLGMGKSSISLGPEVRDLDRDEAR